MLSFETSKKLRDTGLQWEPKVGDWYSYLEGQPELIAFQSTIEKYIQVTSPKWPQGKIITISELLQENTVWLPRLDQLLTEIIKRLPKGTEVMLSGVKMAWQFNIGQDEGDIRWYGYEFVANTPDEAAAKALLWILEQEKGADKYDP